MSARDFSDVRGNDDAVTSLACAVIARCPVMLIGPPGAGKTMIAARAPGLLGPLSEHERAWLVAEYDGRGIGWSDPTERPFRAPHYTISTAALTSGRMPWSATERPLVSACRCKQTLADRPCMFHTLPVPRVPHAGEVRLARFGVLLLDEIVEFTRASLESLRESLREMGATAPVVIAAGQGCPCGWSGSWPSVSTRSCTCTDDQRRAYTARIDRSLATLGIDRSIPVHPVPLADVRDTPPGRSTAELRALVGGLA